jgi:hypothetical protein
VGGTKFDANKDIFSVRLAYNLTGFEFGTLAQWIDGDSQSGPTAIGVKQYRLKAFAKVIF